jgi:hypothetical protein
MDGRGRPPRGLCAPGGRASPGGTETACRFTHASLPSSHGALRVLALSLGYRFELL